VFGRWVSKITSTKHIDRQTQPQPKPDTDSYSAAVAVAVAVAERPGCPQDFVSKKKSRLLASLTQYIHRWWARAMLSWAARGRGTHARTHGLAERGGRVAERVVAPAHGTGTDTGTRCGGGGRRCLIFGMPLFSTFSLAWVLSFHFPSIAWVWDLRLGSGLTSLALWGGWL
jgi:hypothetical protein